MCCQRLFVLSAVVCLLPLSSLAVADDSKDDKTVAHRRGDAYQLAAGKTHNIHANDHARLLGKYAAAAAHPVSQEVLTPHAAAIRVNVDAAQKAYSRIRNDGKSDPQMKAQLTEIQQRLTKVTELVNQLENQSAKQAVEAKTVLDRTNTISQELKQAHLASKKVDQIFGAAVQTGSDFTDRDSDSYYFTGEGHFID
jgi:hypothetical protein